MKISRETLQRMLVATIATGGTLPAVAAEDNPLLFSSRTEYEIVAAKDMEITSSTPISDSCHKGSITLKNIAPGAKIVLKKGAKLSFRGNCSLRLAEGASLVLEPGANVTLKGGSAIDLGAVCVVGAGKEMVVDLKKALTCQNGAPTITDYMGRITDVDAKGKYKMVSCPACGGG
ncbi:MAG: hypothetical protein K2W95_22460 [Candidatus Obscuribacterales bacterium]|nr:hypothetical protein [Candidatus Obscuribacterales bacterium]